MYYIYIYYTQTHIPHHAHTPRYTTQETIKVYKINYLIDSDLSGSVVPTSSRHVITHGLTKGNSIAVENGTVLVPKTVQIITIVNI